MPATLHTVKLPNGQILTAPITGRTTSMFNHKANIPEGYELAEKTSIVPAYIGDDQYILIEQITKYLKKK